MRRNDSFVQLGLRGSATVAVRCLTTAAQSHYLCLYKVVHWLLQRGKSRKGKAERLLEVPVMWDRNVSGCASWRGHIKIW